jgi:DNA-binding MarR family transcriptional regulator
VRLDALTVLRAVEDHYILGCDLIASDLAHRLQCSDGTARRWAKKLVDEGLLKTMPVQAEGVFKLSWATSYFLSAEGEKLLEENDE